MLKVALTKLFGQKNNTSTDCNNNEYKQLKLFVESFLNEPCPDLLIFNDSVSLRTAQDEENQQNFYELLAEKIINKRKFCLISGSGYHSGLYEGFCNLLRSLPFKPKLAVLTINLRSFSPTWYLNPLYTYTTELNSINEFRLMDKIYDIKPAATNINTNDLKLLDYDFDSPAITLTDFNELISTSPLTGSLEWQNRLQTIFKYHYMYKLKNENMRLCSYTNLVKSMLSQNINVYLYITPINYVAGTEFCGNEFVSTVRENINTILANFKTHNLNYDNRFSVDDFAFMFKSDMFFTPHNATEHLRHVGRKFIIDNIVSKYKTIHINGEL